MNVKISKDGLTVNIGDSLFLSPDSVTVVCDRYYNGEETVPATDSTVESDICCDVNNIAGKHGLRTMIVLGYSSFCQDYRNAVSSRTVRSMSDDGTVLFVSEEKEQEVTKALASFLRSKKGWRWICAMNRVWNPEKYCR